MVVFRLLLLAKGQESVAKVPQIFLVPFHLHYRWPSQVKAQKASPGEIAVLGLAQDLQALQLAEHLALVVRESLLYLHWFSQAKAPLVSQGENFAPE